MRRPESDRQSVLTRENLELSVDVTIGVDEDPETRSRYPLEGESALRIGAGAASITAETVAMQQSGCAQLTAGTVAMKESGAAVIIADTVEGEDVRCAVLGANAVSGNVHCLVDRTSAFVIGGAVLAAAVLAGSLLVRRR